jgi:hypothetical protein
VHGCDPGEAPATRIRVGIAPLSRPAGTGRVAKRVLGALRERGWLLQADPELPSVATLVAGAVRGSWWSHPKSNEIYWVLEALDESPEVLAVKLVKEKLTLLHRALWPALVAVGGAGDRWQTAGLSRAAQSLLARTRKAGALRLDRLERWTAARKPGDAARELERRLLVHSREIHTESGKHAKELESWSHFASGAGLGALPAVPEARRALERAVASEGETLLPWTRRPRPRARPAAVRRASAARAP